MKIIIMGDVHGNFGLLNTFINKQNPDIIIVCGDFGYWPELIRVQNGWYGSSYIRGKDFDISVIKNHDCKVYWVPGNHEDWNDIDKNFVRNGVNPIEMREGSNIFFCPIGSIIKLKDKNILCIGGAKSTDKEYRQPGVTWFPQENLTKQDYDFIMNYDEVKIDCVVSHTCPRLFDLDIDYPEKWGDPNRLILDQFLLKFKPDKWFFGHWHDFKQGKYKNTEWCLLDHNYGRNRQWIKYE